MKQIRVSFVFLFLLAMMATPKTLTIEKVGEWGRGSYIDFYIKGDYVYCCSGSGGLDIIDIRNHGQPKIVGNYNTDTYIMSVNIIDNYAFLMSGGGEMQIVDISNPYHPDLVGAYDDPQILYKVYVSGHYAYVGQGKRGLKILDVSNPLSPSLAGTLDESEYGGTVPGLMWSRLILVTR